VSRRLQLRLGGFYLGQLQKLEALTEISINAYAKRQVENWVDSPEFALLLERAERFAESGVVLDSGEAEESDPTDEEELLS
jgi:pantoate kinase